MGRLKFSLFKKIMTWFFLNLVLLAIALVAFFGLSFRLDFSSFTNLTSRMAAVSAVIGEEVSGRTRTEKDAILAKYEAAYGVRFFIFDNLGNQLAGSPVELPDEVVAEILFPESGPKALGFVPSGPPPSSGPPPLRGAAGNSPPSLAFFVTSGNPTRFWSGGRFMLTEPGRAEPVRARVLAVSTTPFGGGLFFDPTPWLIVIALVLVGSTLFWLPFVRRITRAVGEMSDATARLAEEDFDVVVEESRTDELGELGGNINHLARRLSGYVSGQRRLLGDISHELNSPLARMQFALGILDEIVRDDERKYVESVREEVEAMTKMVGELLSYSKAGIKSVEIETESIGLRVMVDEVVARETGGNGADVRIEIADELVITANRELAARALGNVVRNAIRYAGEAGAIEVGAMRSENAVTVLVRDSGSGVPADSIDRLFDPFYRVERDRSRASGGSGLGLAIVKTCVEACGGRVAVRNRQPRGLEVELIFKSS